MEKRAFTRRRADRITLPALIDAAVGAHHEVRIRDLSLAGARLEHSRVLHPSDHCHLCFRIGDAVVVLAGRLVWSSVVGRASPPDEGILFQTGMAFEHVPSQTRALLAQFLAKHQPATRTESCLEPIPAQIGERFGP
ncbi:MAG TPA: PilZ domain-containing protein [Candidatus Sulfotelmatobacter sp.]|nr:PilZ domain-containing protein [Candidatus Sulfotelmatobacter sp.]